MTYTQMACPPGWVRELKTLVDPPDERLTELFADGWEIRHISYFTQRRRVENIGFGFHTEKTTHEKVWLERTRRP